MAEDNAVRTGASPGTLHRLDVSALPLDRDLFKSSTHALGLADAVELSRTFGALPPRVFVFGVEVRELSVGVGLSPEVERARPVIVDEVLRCARGQWWAAPP